jgi:hypothetical protein
MIVEQQNQRKIELLEKQLQQCQRQLAEVAKRLAYVERENTRRKTEVSQIISALKK